LSRRLARWIQPSAAVVDPGSRREAQLVSAFTLALTVLMMAGMVAGIAQYNATTTVIGEIVLIVVFLTAYAISRTPHYQWATILVVGALSLTAFVSIINNPERVTATALAYLPITFLMAGFLLPVRIAAAIIAIDTAVMLLLPRFIPAIPMRDAGAVGGLTLTVGVIILIISAVRGLTERDRLALLTKANQELHELQGSLEKRVEERTAQLRASADVGRAAASILDTDLLLREVVNLISDRFGFYYAAVFLVDEAYRWAVLREATGETGRILKERGHRLEVSGQSMVGMAIRTRQPRIALDVGAEAVRFANPLLPDTRSEIALPLVVGQQVLGALDVQSTQMAAFDEAFTDVLQAMADQIAIALSNTLQFQTTETALQAARQMNEASLVITQADSVPQVVAGLMERGMPDAEQALLVTYGPRDDQGELIYYEIAASWSRQPDNLLILPQTRFDPEQLPFLQAIKPARPLLLTQAPEPSAERVFQEVLEIWQAQALAGFALTAGEQPVGLLLITFGTPHTFLPDEVQTMTTLVRQAAVVLRNRQLVEESQRTLQQLNEANQRLIGLAWQNYTTTTGGQIRKVKTGRGLPPNTPDTPLPSAVSTPVVVNGVEIGALRLEDESPDREWTSAERALLQAVAGEVSIALEKARLNEETEKRAQRERTLNRIAGRIRSAQTVAQVLEIAAQELNQNTSAPRSVVEIKPRQDTTATPSGNGAKE
jgi:GAF domain-containing protein